MLSPPQRTQEPYSPSPEKKPAFLRSKTDITPTGLRAHGLGISHKHDQPYASETPSQSLTHLSPSLTSPGYANYSRSQTSLMSGLSEKLSGSSKTTTTHTAAPAKGKSRLRNPMSLLLRRRSGQTLDPLHDESLVTQHSPSFVPPIRDNYDPSIRGNIVHDFNAPRLNRNFSYSNAYGSTPVLPGTPGELGRVSPPKVEREHTPVFREHFDDDTSYEQSQAAVRAEQLANNDFVARNSILLLSEPSPPEPAPAPRHVPPPVAKETPSEPLTQSTSSPPPPPYQAIDINSSLLSPVEEVPSPTYAPTDDTPRAKKSTKSPPPTRSRATSVTDPSWQPAGLPAHFSSRASRFSFQINGGSDSTQEHVMEERHRKKAAEKASKQAHMSTNTIEDEYDEYGMDDDFDMDGDFEEEIPMLGEEDEFAGLGDRSINDGINTFDFSTLSANPSLTTQMTSVAPSGQLQTPYDVNGNPIGFAMSGGMLQVQSTANTTYLNPEEDDDDDDDELQQSYAPRFQPNLQLPPKQTTAESSLPGATSSTDLSPEGLDLDDDMYFDDGLIGEQDPSDAAAFNEDMFDDPEGPLYERKTKAPVEDTPSSQPLQALPSETGYEADDDTLIKHLGKSEPSLAHKTSVAHAPAGPTMFEFNDMSTYHTALVDAANRAEAEGRFARTASIDIGTSSSELDDSSVSHSRPSLVPDDGRFSVDTVGFPPDDDVYGTDMSFLDDGDYSEYDSALENDPMIAAANAEALAYDDEGFYGSEFGFYAAAGDAQSEWGGVFGASGLNRAVSGRNAVREPNLTPITERSEFSTRNSFISLNHFRDGTLPIASPGLAQLARMSPYEFPGEEEDMSLDTLMRLRKGAFGGSASSLPSSTANSPRNSSPYGMQFALRANGAAGSRMQEQYESEIESDESANAANNFDDDAEDDDGLMDAVNDSYGDDDGDGYSDGDERPESPTLTASDYNTLSSPTGPLQTLPPFSPPQRPQILQMQSLYMQPPHLPSAMKSPANIALPISPFGMPLPSPFTMSTHPASPPPIDTSLSSPAATSSTGPRRQSVGFASPISATSPMTPSGSGWRGGHSRKGSAADSVTYVREHDEAGEGRWVLERRRTAESGELELIGREIVEGGRI